MLRFTRLSRSRDILTRRPKVDSSNFQGATKVVVDHGLTQAQTHIPTITLEPVNGDSVGDSCRRLKPDKSSVIVGRFVAILGDKLKGIQTVAFVNNNNRIKVTAFCGYLGKATLNSCPIPPD